MSPPDRFRPGLIYKRSANCPGYIRVDKRLRKHRCTRSLFSCPVEGIPDTTDKRSGVEAVTLNRPFNNDISKPLLDDVGE